MYYNWEIRDSTSGLELEFSPLQLNALLLSYDTPICGLDFCNGSSSGLSFFMSEKQPSKGHFWRWYDKRFRNLFSYPTKDLYLAPLLVRRYKNKRFFNRHIKSHVIMLYFCNYYFLAYWPCTGSMVSYLRFKVSLYTTMISFLCSRKRLHAAGKVAIIESRHWKIVRIYIQTIVFFFALKFYC